MAIHNKSREQELEELNNFINTSQDKVNEIIQFLGWSDENLSVESEEMVCCDWNKEHRIPKSKLKDHLELCSWKQEGYHKNDIPLPDSCGLYSDTALSTIVLDKEQQATVIRDALQKNPSMRTGVCSASGLDDRPVPRTSDRLISNFTPDERLALYDYVIARTGAGSSVNAEDFNLLVKKEDKARPKTKLELLIEQRDAKRRRMSYRHKKVHTNRKSQTEILREVIKNQMEALEELLNEKEDGREMEDGMTLGNLAETERQFNKRSEVDDAKAEYKNRGARWKDNREEQVQDSKYNMRETSHSWNRSPERDRRKMKRQYDTISSHSSTRKQSGNRRRSRSKSKDQRSWDHKKNYYRDTERKRLDYSFVNPYEAARLHEKREREVSGDKKISNRGKDSDKGGGHCRKSSRSQDLDKEYYNKRSNRSRDLEREDCNRSSRSESSDKDESFNYRKANFSSDSRNGNKNYNEQNYYFDYKEKYHYAAEDIRKSTDKTGIIHKRYYEDSSNKQTEVAHSSKESGHYSKYGEKSKDRSYYSLKTKNVEYAVNKVQRRTSDEYSRDISKLKKRTRDTNDISRDRGTNNNIVVDNTLSELYGRPEKTELTEKLHWDMNYNETQRSDQHCNKRPKTKRKKKKHRKRKRSSSDTTYSSGHSSKES